MAKTKSFVKNKNRQVPLFFFFHFQQKEGIHLKRHASEKGQRVHAREYASGRSQRWALVVVVVIIIIIVVVVVVSSSSSSSNLSMGEDKLCFASLLFSFFCFCSTLFYSTLLCSTVLYLWSRRQEGGEGEGAPSDAGGWRQG